MDFVSDRYPFDAPQGIGSGLPGIYRGVNSQECLIVDEMTWCGAGTHSTGDCGGAPGRPPGAWPTAATAPFPRRRGRSAGAPAEGSAVAYDTLQGGRRYEMDHV
ncbi:hypothetical protein GCM10010392_38810 [Streptomyces clavifer]|nr:hypothetical protein GCM10010392_38810 [Streptomyces clavifer]